ncbi:unnamed protein product [Allacma fusca]|uniref:O-acyltransferase WSD1 C-terminal domain-containing protein n=1 Tax=Allacma fusca TaxID=39272 RepID=A0A8J2NTW5_9HEXA|nr:unnamed protein product [Allacma fusca]
MKFVHLCKKLWALTQVLALTVILFIFFLLIAVPVTGALIFRTVLAKILLYWRKDLSKILTTCAHVFAVDDVESRPNVNVVITLTFKGTITVQSLLELFQERIISLKNPEGSLHYPELQQFYHQWMGFLFWKWDPNFDLQNHLRLYDYPDLKIVPQENISHGDLARINANLMRKSWAKGRSPWEFLVIPNFVEEEEDLSQINDNKNPGTALIFRFHHGIGDGFGFFNLLWTYFAGGEATLETIEDDYRNLKSHFTPKHSLCYYALSPVIGHFELARQLLECNDANDWKIPDSQLIQSGMSAMTGRIPVEDIKEIRRTYQITFSGAILGLISGAMRQSMIDLEFDVPERMHGLLPIPSRWKNRGKLRNYISYIYPELPVGTGDFKTRFLLSDSNLRSLKKSTLPVMNKLLHQTSGAMPACIVKGFQKNVFATALISIFPGPKKTAYLLGNPMTDITFATSCHGNSGICISVLSYDSSIRVLVNVNEAVPSRMTNLAEIIVRNIEKELHSFHKNEDFVV